MFDIRRVTTAAELEVALGIRRQVFVDEQGIDNRLELDEFDHLLAGVMHWLAYEVDRPVGAARLRTLNSEREKLERFAVLRACRGKGIGAALVAACERVAAERGISELGLHSQESARGFYEKLGYVAHGDRFDEAGIGHIRMNKVLRVGRSS